MRRLLQGAAAPVPQMVGVDLLPTLVGGGICDASQLSWQRRRGRGSGGMQCIRCGSRSTEHGYGLGGRGKGAEVPRGAGTASRRGGCREASRGCAGGLVQTAEPPCARQRWAQPLGLGGNRTYSVRCTRRYAVRRVAWSWCSPPWAERSQVDLRGGSCRGRLEGKCVRL